MIIDESTYPLIVLAILGILILLEGAWIWQLERRIKRLLGKNSLNIESTILKHREQIDKQEKFQHKATETINDIENRIRKSIRAIETVRFNPFKGSGAGGNQSFSSVFLNEEGDGIVLSGLHLRERISVYAKPVKNFGAEFELSEEERDVINRAQEKLKK